MAANVLPSLSTRALTAVSPHGSDVGYRSSLTEIARTIGRTTRDAPASLGRSTNLIAEPEAQVLSKTCRTGHGKAWTQLG
jgi:hypothetical protein